MCGARLIAWGPRGALELQRPQYIERHVRDYTAPPWDAPAPRAGARNRAARSACKLLGKKIGSSTSKCFSWQNASILILL